MSILQFFHANEASKHLCQALQHRKNRLNVIDNTMGTLNRCNKISFRILCLAASKAYLVFIGLATVHKVRSFFFLLTNTNLFHCEYNHYLLQRFDAVGI